MFVYEVRGNMGYDGIGDRFLVKDDEYSLEKVKGTLIEMLNKVDYPTVVFSINEVNELSKLEDYHSFEVGYFLSFEVLKIKVI